MSSTKHINVLCFAYCCVGAMSQVLPSTLDFIGSRRPGMACTFNPCTIPNFCGPGRSCEIDKNCMSSCECLEGSSHPECAIERQDASVADKQINEIKTQQTDINHDLDETQLTKDDKDPPVTPVNSALQSRPSTIDSLDECPVDPCTTMSWICDGGRTCVNRGCIVHCECTTGSTHNTCVTTAQEPPDAANETEDCGGFTGMKCQHGTCVQIGGALSCACYEEWKGALCDQHVSTGCTRACDPGYECQWYMDTMQICTPVLTTPKQDIGSNPDNVANISMASNVCMDGYTPHPESRRNCSSGLRCLYGVCGENIRDHGPVCRCDPGASGLTCNETCCLDCGVGGQCYIDGGSGEEMCRCLHNYTGANCTELKSSEVSDGQWYVWVVGTCSGVLLVLIILVVIVPYIMWKHRVILVMKVVHYFQGYEDDDEREWDAFISYKSTPTDEAFVTRVLFRKLEEEFGFKLNVHFRDFVPGDTIANNIIRAVKGSRRTILVITPQYIKSEFTKLEYQVAQQQMLRHKHRIIPILLEDISDCEQFMDPNLKFILRSVTFLEWPRNDNAKDLNRFWKRLQLSMPKKRHPTRQNNILERPNAVDNENPKRTHLKPPGMVEQNGHNRIVIPKIHIENEEDHYHKLQDVVRL